MKKWFCIGIAGLVHGCTGTDHIADPPMTVDPRILVIPDMAAVQVGESRRFEATYFDDPLPMPPSAGPYRMRRSLPWTSGVLYAAWSRGK